MDFAELSSHRRERPRILALPLEVDLEQRASSVSAAQIGNTEQSVIAAEDEPGDGVHAVGGRAREAMDHPECPSAESGPSDFCSHGRRRRKELSSVQGPQSCNQSGRQVDVKLIVGAGRRGITGPLASRTFRSTIETGD